MSVDVEQLRDQKRGKYRGGIEFSVRQCDGVTVCLLEFS